MPRLTELKVFGGETRFGGYVIVDAIYTEHVSDGWLFSGKVPKGLVLTEHADADDGDDVGYADLGAVEHRKWAGPMAHEDIQRFRSAWDLRHKDSEPNMGMITEFGHLPGDRFVLDPMDWNSGGWTPLLDVSVGIFDAEAVADEF